MLVSGSMFARPSTSKSDNPQLSRAMTPVVKLGLAVSEGDCTATKEVSINVCTVIVLKMEQFRFTM